MKKRSIIILLVVLLGGVGGAVLYFKLKDKKQPKASTKEAAKPTAPKAETSTLMPPMGANPRGKQIAPQEAIQYDIEVAQVDSQNRSFEYSMHYMGIPYKGKFIDGLSKPLEVKKAFGSFLVKQRMREEIPLELNQTKAKSQKMRGVTSKGGATKTGATQLIKHLAVHGSDWVDLFILDPQERILKQVTVNLKTGNLS